MGFKITDKDVNDFYRNGYTVFRGILPASLIADLRRVTNCGRELVRSAKNGQTQRFQPVCDFDIDQRPFEDYANLPELHEALGKVLSPQHVFGNTKWLGVLIEPAERSYCTQWHRDARELIKDENEWNSMLANFDSGNQVNCALWEDSCTWFVPGSHLRGDLDSERVAFETFPPRKPILNELNDEEREQQCLAYGRQMPGAIQLHLNAGDFALYRPLGWHLGSYTPYKRRATLHDGVWLPEAGERWMRRLKELSEMAKIKR